MNNIWTSDDGNIMVDLASVTAYSFEQTSDRVCSLTVCAFGTFVLYHKHAKDLLKAIKDYKNQKAVVATKPPPIPPSNDLEFMNTWNIPPPQIRKL